MRSAPHPERASGWYHGGSEAIGGLGPTAAWSHRPPRPGRSSGAANAGYMDGSARRVAGGRGAVPAAVVGHPATLGRRLGEHRRARRRPRCCTTPRAARSVPTACKGGAVDSSHFSGSHAVHTHGVRQASAGHATVFLFKCECLFATVGSRCEGVCSEQPCSPVPFFAKPASTVWPKCAPGCPDARPILI